MDHQVIIVYSTAPDEETARRIAQTLVEQKLAACVSLIPGLHSVYRWQGAVEEATEIGLMIKTTQECFSMLSSLLTSLHPYDVPEIIALPVVDGLNSYLQWIKDETV